MESEIVNPKHLGEVIVRRRRRLGLTQKALAEKAGISPSLMCRYEQGTTRIGKANFRRVSGALEWTPQTLLAETWQVSEAENASAEPAAKAEPVAVFPEAEFEKIYDESLSDGKKLYLRTCRALFDALRNSRPPRAS
jgi:transcriptional regulator with XRE-family HTH domain